MDEEVTSEGAIKPLDGSYRSSLVGNERGSVFIVGFQDASIEKTKKGVPARLKKYSERTTPTAHELEQKQREAADRKQKIDDNKRRQARIVSQHAIDFDRKVKSRLQNSNPRWFEQVLKK